MTEAEIRFNFTSPRIIFGRGRINALGKEVLSILKPRGIPNPKILLVTGTNSLKESGNLEKIRAILRNSNINIELYDKAGKEPTTNILNEGKEIALAKNCDLIIGVGGGSVMDTAKGISGLVTNGGIVEDYQEGKEFLNPPKPFILIPTTSGTGSEVTNNSVVKNEKTGLKKSIRGLWASLALLDPELTLSLPKKYTAYPGADALVQAIEALVSKSANFISDFFSRKSIAYLGDNLPKVCDDLLNIDLREKMMLGSILGAISFANGKLGAVHGFAHPIGIKHNLPHGLICGLLLPHVMKYNMEVKQVAQKYSWIAELFHHQKILVDYGSCPKSLPSNIEEKAEWAIKKIEDIFTYVEVPLRLSEVGIIEADFDEIIKDTTGSSLANNPRDTNKETLREILVNAL